MTKTYLKSAARRFVISTTTTAAVIAALGYLILYSEEYMIWMIIGTAVSLVTGLIAALIPSVDPWKFIGYPLLLALSICYFLFTSY